LKVADDTGPGAEVTETTVERLSSCRFRALVKRWDKCINVGGGYVEKYFFFQLRISYVICFISICDLFTALARRSLRHLYKVKDRIFIIE
jgi:hypothetical protein